MIKMYLNWGRKRKMRKTVLLIFMLAVPILTVCIFIAVAGVYYVINRSTDEVPDTSSIYVYTVDGEFGELNQVYCKGSGVVPGDKSSMITYKDIPEISKLEGVKDIYILNEIVLWDFQDSIMEGESKVVSIPSEIVRYYSECSGMSMYSKEPSDGEYSVFECHTEVVEGKYYEEVAAPSSAEPEYSLYYKYDPATWDQFAQEMNKHLTERDAGDGDISMLITTRSADDGKALQQRLMKDYPASNYDSAEFTESWMKAYNGNINRNITVAAVISGVLLIGIETGLGLLMKTRKKDA